ncbi:hypothetical protein U1Q18_030760 [Sarracenia purpurea var. burkii]
MEPETDKTPSSSNTMSKTNDKPGPSCSAVANTFHDEILTTDLGAPSATRLQGIPTPEIYESPKLISVPVKKKENTQIQLLDINFPPNVAKTLVLQQPTKRLPYYSEDNCGKALPVQQPLLREEERFSDRGQIGPLADADIASTGSVNGAQSEVRSSSSPVEVSEGQNGYYSSEGETTMYSAETAESRNYPSPRERFQRVGRSQSCVNYNRWGAVQRNPVVRNQRAFMQARKISSQGATSQRSNDYFSPTVSSIMKKRNNSEQPNGPRQNVVHSSPRWMF